MTAPSSQTVPGARLGGAAAVVLALYAETPLHPGSGQSTGVVDLPVQRERHTGFPLIPATSLKGSLRSLAERRWGRNGVVQALFGPEAQAGGEHALHAGALALTDARLLAFPVRSLHQVFLWVTCPLALGRLARDLRLAGHEQVAPDLPPTGPVEAEAVVPQGLSGTLVLEDLSFRTTPDEGWGKLAARLVGLLPAGEAHRVYREKFARHLVLLNDADFAYLVQHATQVTARIALNEHKTTTGDGGNLWYEETVPADTLFTSLVLPGAPRVPNERRQHSLAGAAEVRDQFMELIKPEDAPSFLQVGGNETVGQGWCALRVVEVEGEGEGEGDARD